MKGVLTLIIIIFSCYNFTNAQQNDDLSILVNNLFDYNNPSLQNKAMKKIISRDYSFDMLYNRLNTGKIYSSKVETGWIEKINIFDNSKLYFIAYIPKNYDCNKKYPLQLNLHGGVSNLNPQFVKTLLDTQNIKHQKIDHIIVWPSSWLLAQWWTMKQYMHIHFIVNYFKNQYNIDENKIYLTGISDGAQGVFYIANLSQTIWASYGTFIGYMGALTHFSKQQVYISNYKNKSFFIQNSKRDSIFPYTKVKPYLNLMKSANVDMKLVLLDTCGHDMSWYPAYQDTVKQFFEYHPRNPFPDELCWSTEFEKQFNRCYWLNIIDIAEIKSDETCVTDYNFNSIDFASKFHRNTIFGTISANKIGNSIFLCTNKIKRFSILFSPSHFDFNNKIKIYLNDTLVFENLLDKDISVLLKWAKQDIDRQMLYGAEIKIKIGKRPKVKVVTYK